MLRPPAENGTGLALSDHHRDLNSRVAALMLVSTHARLGLVFGHYGVGSAGEGRRRQRLLFLTAGCVAIPWGHPPLIEGATASALTLVDRFLDPTSYILLRMISGRFGLPASGGYNGPARKTV
jgi:hypothetical protein